MKTKSCSVAAAVAMLGTACGGGGTIEGSIANATLRAGVNEAEGRFDLTLRLPEGAGSTEAWLYSLEAQYTDGTYGGSRVTEVTGGSFPIALEPGDEVTTTLGFKVPFYSYAGTGDPCAQAGPLPMMRLHGGVYDDSATELVTFSGDLTVEAPPPSRSPPTAGALWSRSFGDADSQLLGGVAVDGAGASVLVGHASGTIDFGAGSTLGTTGPYAPFLAELDADGNHVHSRTFPSSGGFTGQPTLTHVAIDSGGNIVVAGSFEGTMDLGAGPLTSAGFRDVVVAKLDTHGNALWSRRFGDAEHQVVGSLGIDDAGNIVLGGAFLGSVDFGGGTFPPPDAPGVPRAFVVELDAAGNHRWSKAVAFSEQPGPLLSGVAGDGTVILAGSFWGTAQLGDGQVRQSQGTGSDAFLMKLDAAGEPLWVQQSTEPSSVSITHLAVNARGDIAFGGTYEAGFALGPFAIGASSYTSAFVARLNADGSAGHHVALSQGAASLAQLAIGATGNVLASGYLQQGWTLDLPGSPLLAAGYLSAYFVELDPAGSHLRSHLQECSAEPPRIAVAPADSTAVVLAGNLGFGSLDLGQGPLTHAGAGDFYVAQLPPAP
jgi:hypothetical protein